MCEQCGCKSAEKKIQYVCDCKMEDCNCTSIIEFDNEPKATPFCCGTPMKRVK